MKYIGQDPAVLDNFATAVANGAISSGDPCIIESAGTVAAVASSGTGIPTLGSYTEGTGSLGDGVGVAFDSGQNVHVFSYANPNNSYYGTLQAFSLSGGSITAGTAVVFNTANTYNPVMAYDENAGKSLVFYKENVDPRHTFARVVTATGTSLSLGTETTIESENAYTSTATYDANAQKILLIGSLYSNGDIYARVATISGTSVSVGSRVSWLTGTFYGGNDAAVYLPTSQKILLVAEDHATTTAKSAVATISGTSVSFGSTTTISINMYGAIGLAVDSQENILLVSQDDSITNDPLYAVGGSVSGTTVTFGTPVQVNSTTSSWPTVVFDSSSNVFVYFYLRRDGTSSNYDTYGGTATVSGNVPNIVSNAEVRDGTANYNLASYDSDQNQAILFNTVTQPTNIGFTAFPVTTNALTQNLTAENFIGFADKGYADGSDAVIQAKGAVNDKQTSLTAGQSYFVQTDGTLGTTADDPSVFAGTAVSATQLIVKG